MQALLADFILIAHALFVAFVVGGLAVIWIGALRGWQIVRNFRFRVLHMAAILFVCAEALIGVACPLTVWEDQLRGRASESGFIARWLHRILYYDFPEWVFLTLYILFTLAVAASLFLIPPRRNRQRK
ncbi:MAG: DUF2784 domain-containing protein [Burkholderiales bacterium]